MTIETRNPVINTGAQINGNPKPSTWTFLDVLLITLSSTAIIIAGILTIGWLSQPQTTENSIDNLNLGLTVAITALEAFGLLFSILVFAIWRKKISWIDLGLQQTSRIWIFRAIIATGVLIPLAGIVAYGLQILLELPFENPQLQFLAPGGFTWIGAAGMVIFGGLIVPLAEELFFRGVLYAWTRQFLPASLAIFLNAVIFGLLHGDLAIAGATALMGLVLAWFYERTGSLWPSILVHALNNSVKLIFLYILLATGIEIPGIT